MPETYQGAILVDQQRQQRGQASPTEAYQGAVAIDPVGDGSPDPDRVWGFGAQQIEQMARFPGGGVLGDPIGPQGLRPLYVGGQGALDGSIPEPGRTDRVVWAPQTSEEIENVPAGSYYWNPQTNSVEVRGYRQSMDDSTGNPWRDNFAKVRNAFGDVTDLAAHGITFGLKDRKSVV